MTNVVEWVVVEWIFVVQLKQRCLRGDGLEGSLIVANRRSGFGRKNLEKNDPCIVHEQKNQLSH